MNTASNSQQPSSQPQRASSAQSSQSSTEGRGAGRPPRSSRQPRTLQGLQRRDSRERTSTEEAEGPRRLVSLDAYRGFIMMVLAAGGFGIYKLTQLPADAAVWNQLDYDLWQQIGFHFTHPAWISQFDLAAVPGIGVAFWDLIQPAFMFMVGVAMPYSYARREAEGQGLGRRISHALKRAIVLVLLGVFLRSTGASQTMWEFFNVLAQIGLGYLFAYILLGRRFWVQLLALVVILVGYWGFFYSYTPPEDYDYAAVGATDDEMILTGRFAPWSKNANAGYNFDVWFLNQFPRPQGDEFEYNPGGYLTLNFVPSIGTILLGIFCGQLLQSEKRWWQKFLFLVIGGAVCMGLAVLAGLYVCPIVKRIWTPSWVLFSGAWVIWMLAAFYLVFDLCRLRWLAFPLAVIGVNSIAMYLMAQLLRPWATETVKIHFTGTLQRLEDLVGVDFLAQGMYAPIVWPTAAFIVFWLIICWMYGHKFFIRV
ncbi:MAG: acyltransferase family protein [Planctomycetota bacterium]